MTESLSTVTLPAGDEWIDSVSRSAVDKMRRHDGCTQCIVSAFLDALDISAPTVIRSAAALFGGMTCSLTCGIHTGGLMVLGVLMGRENLADGLDGLMPIVTPAQGLIQRLNRRLGSHSCKELTGVDFSDLNQAVSFYASNGHARCIERVGVGAEEIARYLKELDEQGGLYRFGGHSHSPPQAK